MNPNADPIPQRLHRRDFLRTSAGAMLATMILRTQSARAEDSKRRAAIIGHTGVGDYGHGLDLIFDGRPDIELVAVADADAAGLARAKERLKAARAFADYRLMIEQERPELVSVAPRQTIEHHAMVMAALRAGAHVFCEKPFTTTLAEADELLAEADRRGLKIAVAHQMRMQPAVTQLKRLLADGDLGQLIEMHAWGKQDARAGGEDMMVLGVHLFDLMRLFAGEPEWCTARVRTGGRDITTADARTPKDNVGPVAGDEVFAQFSFASGTRATFTSDAKLRAETGEWGLELQGTKGAARILGGLPSAVFLRTTKGWTPNGRHDEWRKLADPTVATGGTAFAAANKIVVDDWLAATVEKREPECSGRNAAKAIEMVMSVYHAALTGRRAAFPLPVRTHPLATGLH